MNGCNIVKMEQPAIELNKLTIGYTHNGKEISVMGDINATLMSGEMVALIGANGAGKSTLMRTLSAFQKQLSGDIVYGKNRVNAKKADELATTLAVVLTGSNKIYNMSVREVVALGRTPYTNFIGHLRAHDEEIIDRAMQRVNIAHLADRDINAISDGERQKVMIAKALAQETPIIMLDEPTAFLDFKSRVELFRLLKELANNQKKAILVSTHDLELVLQLADKLWLIHNKKLHCGTIEELTESNALSIFIDSEGIIYNRIEKKIDIR